MAEGGGFLYTQAIQPVDAGKNFRDIAAFLQKKREEERARQDKIDAEQRQFTQQERMAGIQSENQLRLAERQSELRKEEKAADRADRNARELDQALKEANKSRKEAVKTAREYNVSPLPDWAEDQFKSWVDEAVEDLNALLDSDSGSFDDMEAERILSEIGKMYDDLSSAIPTQVTEGLDTMSNLLDPSERKKYNDSLDPTQEVDQESLDRVIDTRLSITGNDVSPIINQMRADGEVIPEGNWSFDIDKFAFVNEDGSEEIPVSDWKAGLLQNPDIYTPQTKNRVVGTLQDYAINYLKPSLVGTGEDYNSDTAFSTARGFFNGSPTDNTRGIRIAAADRFMKQGYEEDEIAAFINGDWSFLDSTREAALNKIADRASREMAEEARYADEEVTGTRDVQAEKEERERAQATETLAAASTEYDSSLALNLGEGTIPIVITEGNMDVEYDIYAVNINKDTRDLIVQAYDEDGTSQVLNIPYNDPRWGAVNTGLVGSSARVGIEEMLDDDWLKKVRDAETAAPPIPSAPAPGGPPLPP